VAQWDRSGLDFGRVAVNVTPPTLHWARSRSWCAISCSRRTSLRSACASR
jgi:hypothetical protein